MPEFHTGIVSTVPIAAHAARHGLRGQTVAIHLGCLRTPAVGMMEPADAEGLPVGEKGRFRILERVYKQIAEDFR